MSEGHKIHLNQQTRTLKLRSKDVIAAQALLPGNKSLLSALAVDRDMSAVCVGAALAMRHSYEGRDSKTDKAPGPATIADWLDREPEKFHELETAVLRAAEDHYIAIGKLSRGDLTGEAPPAPTKTSTPSTTASTGSQADTDSTPSSSSG